VANGVMYATHDTLLNADVIKRRRLPKTVYGFAYFYMLMNTLKSPKQLSEFFQRFLFLFRFTCQRPVTEFAILNRRS